MRYARSTVVAVITILLVLCVGASVLAAPVSQVPQPQPALPILVVNTGALNVRSGPGPQYTVVTQVVGGTQLPVLGTNASGTWDLVATAAGNGWVDIQYTLPRGNFAYVPVVTPAVIAQTAATPAVITLTVSTEVPVPELQAPDIIVNTGRLNVRTGPGAQFSTIGSVPGGTVLSGIARNADGSWYLVESPVGNGWVDAEYTLLRGFYENLAVIE